MKDITIGVGPGLEFSAHLYGSESDPLVVMLHGFPESRHTWRDIAAPLAEQGYCVLAPNQRGYSSGARPDPSVAEAYAYSALIGDVVGMVDALRGEDERFHLVGHDWGGQVAWGVADAVPDRLFSLTVLSRPHPTAFANALAHPDGDQLHRSRHHRGFFDPETTSRLLGEDGSPYLAMLRGQGVQEEAVAGHFSVLGTPEAMEAAVTWYRHNPSLAAELAPTRVPTLYVWGTEDSSVGRLAASTTGEHVVARFSMEVFPGLGHFLMEQSPAPIAEVMLAHLRRNAGAASR